MLVRQSVFGGHLQHCGVCVLPLPRACGTGRYQTDEVALGSSSTTRQGKEDELVFVFVVVGVGFGPFLSSGLQECGILWCFECYWYCLAESCTSVCEIKDRVVDSRKFEPYFFNL
eukprot:Rmarinus@m.14231